MIRLEEDRGYFDDFKDVLEISNQRIVLKYKTYCLEISGEQLRIGAFCKSELVVFGNILAVQFLY